MRDYQVLAAASTVLSVIGLIAIAVGAFLQHDRYPGHASVGKIAELLGWAGWIATSVVNTRLTAELGVDCDVFGRRCDELHNTTGYMWTYIIGPILLDAFWGACAHGVGWVLAKTTRRAS
jgi:hypothetical protein